MELRFPLSWPMNWPRQKNRTRSPFRLHPFGAARDALLAELTRLDARKLILSTNIETRADGLPYANRRNPDDPGVAVYFDLDGKCTTLACDRWISVEENLWAIAKHIEALRGQDRWGVGTIAQAFRGYQALPAPIVPEEPWWHVLSVGQLAPATHVAEAYRLLAMKFHPDIPGGSHHAMARLNRAKEAYEKEKGIKL